MEPSEVRFVAELAAAFPAVARLAEAHVRDYDETLPYLLLADVARHAEALHRGGSEAGRREIDALCAFLETAYAGADEALQTLIVLGFLENLGGPPDAGWRVRERLGPLLRAEIERVWPSSSVRP